MTDGKASGRKSRVATSNGRTRSSESVSKDWSATPAPGNPLTRRPNMRRRAVSAGKSTTGRRTMKPVSNESGWTRRSLLRRRVAGNGPTNAPRRCRNRRACVRRRGRTAAGLGTAVLAQRLQTPTRRGVATRTNTGRRLRRRKPALTIPHGDDEATPIARPKATVGGSGSVLPRFR